MTRFDDRDPDMRTMARLAFVLLTLGLSGDLIADDRATRQAQLDQACEAARQAHLAPLREAMIRKCMRDSGKPRSACEPRHGNYGERAGNRPALFYDLPECERAFDYQRSYRRAE
ncbi:MAG: hypothetical protein P8103_03000 [Candidatus Thiodiazotropha sp.]